MPKLPRISGKQVISLLIHQGYTLARQKGSHVILKKAYMNPVVVPLHDELDRGTLLEILRQAHLSKEQFFQLLN